VRCQTRIPLRRFSDAHEESRQRREGPQRRRALARDARGGAAGLPARSSLTGEWTSGWRSGGVCFAGSSRRHQETSEVARCLHRGRNELDSGFGS
jgi:hypothetical protein